MCAAREGVTAVTCSNGDMQADFQLQHVASLSVVVEWKAWCQVLIGLLWWSHVSSVILMRLYFKKENSCYNCIIWNSTSLFAAAKLGSLSSTISIAEAEALSAREALSWLKFLHYTHIVLKFDSVVFFNALTSCDFVLSYFSSIIEDCKTISRSFVSCLFSRVARSTNILAHSLARVVHLNLLVPREYS